MATLVYLSLSGRAPAYIIAADYQLVSDEGRRQLRSATHEGRVLWDEHSATMDTSVLYLQVQSCGIAFHLICDNPTLNFNE